jgi:hypothetical protein
LDALPVLSGPSLELGDGNAPAPRRDRDYLQAGFYLPAENVYR